ncbi:MAG: AMP-binding protein [Desulfobacteraceae bacterium]|jgi:crotonobetaine/carnitine-CoA ligase
MNKRAVRPWTKIPDYHTAKDITFALLDFDPAGCTRCGICTFICPARSIGRKDGNGAGPESLPYLKSVTPGLTNCIGCGCCLAACPESAIRIERGFDPGRFYRRLSQTPDLTWPNLYLPPEAGNRDTPVKKESHGTPDFLSLPTVNTRRALRQAFNLVKLIKNFVVGVGRFAFGEILRGRGRRTLSKFAGGTAFDISWAQLLEQSAQRVPEKRCLLYNDEVFTYRQMDANANRLANFLRHRGGGKAIGIGILMRNSPRFLDLFFGAQKIGMYLVPINPELKGDGLVYIVNHSGVETLVVDAELLPNVQENIDRFERIDTGHIIVNDVEPESAGVKWPKGMARLSKAYDHRQECPGVGHDPEDLCLIIYTSGTTGRPKGVVYRYNTSGVQKLAVGGHLFFRPDDIYYTYLSLCHGNALFITVTMSLAVRCTIALSRKFSASRFWDTVRRYDATVFNTIGTIIPILMKQPERSTDRQNNVRVVFSAACPLDMWEPFEKRFGVTLFEVYGAVDGGGKSILNVGTAPPGSLGRPASAKSIRIVDEKGRDVPDGTPGELLFKISSKQPPVEYYKNPQASRRKSKNGFIHTGDIVKRDRNGYLYFVGRNTESMRKGGENVSAYEVEHVIMQYEAVEDVAVYGVPSELGEEEIMAAIKPVDGRRIDPAELRRYLKERLAKYALPRYIRLVEAFPKTNTHRIIKGALAREGITQDTYDALQGEDSCR